MSSKYGPVELFVVCSKCIQCRSKQIQSTVTALSCGLLWFEMRPMYGETDRSAVTTLTAVCLNFKCAFIVTASLYTPFLKSGARLNSETSSQNKTDIEKLNFT